MITQTVGRFTLLRKLPAGGMGRVFEAEDTTSGTRVALKLIDIGTDRDSIEIVEAEKLGAELQKQLCAIEPRVTRIYDFGEIDADVFFICMEYVEGRDLSELITSRLEPQEAALIAAEVLRALEHAHSFSTTIEGKSTRGIVHGDLKPRNIRITPAGEVKVLDFGIAKALSMTRTFTQNLFGSIAYSSPERLNTGEVTVASDLWSVAVVLYEMLTGSPYFAAETAQKLEFTIRNYRALRPVPEYVPEALRRILHRALNPNPAARFTIAAEFAQALEGTTGNVEELSEATRRMFRDVPIDDATRRVGPATMVGDLPTTRASAGPGLTPTAKTESRPVKPRRSLFKTAFQAVSILVVVLVLVAAYFVINEYMVWTDADRLARDVASEKQQNLDTAWQQYQKVSARSHMPVSLWSAQGALRDRLMGDADRVLAQYREAEGPVVSEADWTKARSEVFRALQLEPGDKKVRGTLRLIDGQLARIHGNARHDSRLLEESRQDFEESAKELSKSPDPWLGLARLYIYSLHDVEQGESALHEAERRGHEIGKRETVEIADGYRYRAEQTMRIGDKAQTDGDAERYYDMARDDVARARRLYESVLPWPGATASLTRLDQMLLHMSEATH